MSIDSGRSALERLFEMVTGACVAVGAALTGVTTPQTDGLATVRATRGCPKSVTHPKACTTTGKLVCSL
jgi:hypothetical protein